MSEHSTSEPVVTLPSLPLGRVGAFDPPHELSRLARSHRLVRLVHGDGTPGWLVLNFADASRLLRDPRVSSRRDLRHGAVSHARVRRRREPVAPGFFIGLDPPKHTRYRRLVAGMFTRRRIHELETFVTKCVSACLDELSEAGPTADFATGFSTRISSAIVCRLVGIPDEDGAALAAMEDTVNDLTETAQRMAAAEARIARYLEALAARKRGQPNNDLMSDLVLRSKLTDEELSNVVQLILAGGLHSTANMMSLGILALLCHPAQLALMTMGEVDDGAAVEELLRYVPIFQFGITRTVLEDIELGGCVLRSGEPVTVHVGVANRDPRRLDAGDRLDLERPAVHHLSFGRGAHLCLGQHLARLMLRVAYRQLLDRLPALRLAVPMSDIPMRHGSLIYGVRRLPVTWATS